MEKRKRKLFHRCNKNNEGKLTFISIISGLKNKKYEKKSKSIKYIQMGLMKGKTA